MATFFVIQLTCNGKSFYIQHDEEDLCQYLTSHAPSALKYYSRDKLGEDLRQLETITSYYRGKVTRLPTLVLSAVCIGQQHEAIIEADVTVQVIKVSMTSWLDVQASVVLESILHVTSNAITDVATIRVENLLNMLE